MIEPSLTPTSAARARLLLLPEEVATVGEGERPRVRRYRLSRIATGLPLVGAPPALRAGDHEHLRRLYD